MSVWVYPALVRRIVDGDTLDLDLDMGFHVHIVGRCRLAAVNCPELPTPEGQAAALFTTQLCPLGSVVRFTSKRLDEYGRPLGTVELADGSDLGAKLLEAGQAKPYP